MSAVEKKEAEAFAALKARNTSTIQEMMYLPVNLYVY